VERHHPRSPSGTALALHGNRPAGMIVDTILAAISSFVGKRLQAHSPGDSALTAANPHRPE